MLQQASVVGLVKMILILMLIYFGVKILARLFAPFLVKYVAKKAEQRFGDQFGENGAFRLIHASEKGNSSLQNKQSLFSSEDDFIALEETARLFPQVLELAIEDQAHYKKIIAAATKAADSVPLFLKSKDGDLKIIPSYDPNKEEEKSGLRLVYLGKPLVVEL